jgi:hypothetical protein
MNVRSVHYELINLPQYHDESRGEQKEPTILGVPLPICMFIFVITACATCITGSCPTPDAAAAVPLCILYFSSSMYPSFIVLFPPPLFTSAVSPRGSAELPARNQLD